MNNDENTAMKLSPKSNGEQYVASIDPSSPQASHTLNESKAHLSCIAGSQETVSGPEVTSSQDFDATTSALSRSTLSVSGKPGNENENDDGDGQVVIDAAQQARVEKLRTELQARRGWDAEELGTDQFGVYMREKQRKLREQFAAEGKGNGKGDANNSQSGNASNGVFSGVTVWVDGRTSPSRLEIRRIVMRGGGNFETYLTPKVTHVVADSLAAATRRRFLARKDTNTKYVTAEWIRASVNKGARESELNFPIPGMVDKRQKSVAALMFGPKKATGGQKTLKGVGKTTGSKTSNSKPSKPDTPSRG